MRPWHLRLLLMSLLQKATKYGSLSNENGHVTLAWHITSDAAGDDVFEMRWSEHNGPPVSPPTRTGFGRMAIEEGLKSAIDGEVQLHYLSSGVVCTVRARLPEHRGVRPS
jgi:two-component sensor histidine kinase